MNKYVKWGLIVLAGAGLFYGGYRLYKMYQQDGGSLKFGRKINVINADELASEI